jgi:hypothetical protein
MSCNVTITATAVTNELRNFTGSNDTLLNSYVSEVFEVDTSENGNDFKFKDDFAEKLKAKLGIDANNIPSTRVNDVVNYVREYYNYNHPDINYSSKIQNDSTQVGRFGYNSVNARIFGKRVAANFALDFYHQIMHDQNSNINKTIKENGYATKKEFFADAVKARIEELLADRLSQKAGISVDEVYDLMDANNTEELEKLLGDNPVVQDLNLMAVYKEMNADRESYFEEVWLDSRLGDLRFDENEVTEDTTYNAIEEQEEREEGEDSDDESNNSPTDDKNNSIRVLNEKLGDYNNFMTHVDMSIRSYLNSLKKLNSGLSVNGNPDFNLDNDLGIPDTMNAEECCSVLYGYGNFTNVNAMIESIERIADDVPGFAAFHTMADYLKENTNFAYEVYRTFSKIVISKLETTMDGESVNSRISNRSADKYTSLKFEFLNSVKATAIRTDDKSSRAVFEGLNKQIREVEELYKGVEELQGDETMDVADRLALIEEAEDRKAEIVSELARQLRRYYPTIDDSAIANYITNAGEKNIAKNARTLATILKETIDASYKTSQEFYSRQADINAAYAHNRSLDAQKEERKVSPDEYMDITPLYEKEYVDSSSQAAAFRLAKELVRYTLVKTELNSRNVHGNQSSDVINNSMITNILNTLRTPEALKNFGIYKSQTRQYDFSNIMVEHRDENGRIINFGLFSHNPETNEFTPTSYAARMLNARLFNGASDMGSSTSVLYSEMSKGDYVATGFINFFNAEENRDSEREGDSIDFANYFMRIPSDAPKNFIISAPKYTIRESASGKNDGLFTIDNISEARKLVQQQINSLYRITEEEYLGKYVALNPTKRTLRQLVSDATSKNIGNIFINSLKQVNEKDAKVGDTVTMTFNYRTQEGVDNIYILKGTLSRDNGRLILKAPEFVSFADNAHSSDVNNSLKNHFERKLINSGDIKRSINKNHPLYKQFKHAFMQELQDAATALDKFFVNENGLIATDGENFTFNEGYDNTKNTARKLYAVYHVGKGKTILDKTENGISKLTGSVFHSDRFVITHTDENGNVSEVNYGEKILEEAFDFLYGGANNTYLHTKRGQKGVSVELTDEQENIVDKYLSQFINDYVEDTRERITQYEDFIPQHLLTDDNVAEFALNHHLMYVSFNDLFEGDTKFYKDTQTFLKRAKESQGSGVPYGIVDYTMNLSTPREQIESRLNDKTFVRKKADGTTETLEIGQYNKFRGVTIKNTVRTSEECSIYDAKKKTKDGVVTKKLIDALHEGGMSVKAATEKARNMMSGFNGTTVNDAQSYITFEEWIRRVSARGQLEKYMPLIEAVLDETKPLDANVIGEFIQVQKNFYYDQHYNEKLGVIAPRQIKNAEFVLVPRLIEGTQLEQVYNLMKEKGIDQLNTEETSKAGKCNVLTIWNDKGEITEENVEDFRLNATGAVEEYNYNYLYTQQETPQHVDNKNKAGIQIMKKILDNIVPGSELYSKKEEFFKLYSANIKESFQDLVDELNLQLDENGNLKLEDKNGKRDITGLDVQLFYDRLKEEVARLGLDSNMMDYVTLAENANINDDVPDTKMPTYLSSVSTKLESIAQSMFNSRITRQKLPGFHAAQITNVGWSPLSGQVQSRSYSKDLKYHPDGKPYIEIMLPANNFGLKREKADGSRKTDEELLEELQNSGLDTMIGYRIPTEGKQSICVMKVVGFTDDALGSTIVVPDDWVSQTGSDFDIDSVYGINFKGKVNKKTGLIEKIPYKQEVTEQDYFSYIRRKLDHKVSTKIKGQIESLKEAINDKRNEDYNDMLETEGEKYHALPDEVRNEIKKLQEKHTSGKSKLEKYTQQNNNVVEGLTQYIENNELSEDVKSQIQEYITVRQGINDFINNASEDYREKLMNGISELQEERLANIEKLAKDAGLLSYQEYSNLDATERNNRDARNNQLLQSMIDILSSSESLEENLSRSNFEDIINARNASIDENIAKRRNQRSPYNFLDQAEYQEDVMSGAKLKAFSVTRDTFCSICNTVRPTISDAQQVKIVYRAEDGYTKAALKKTFDNVEEISDGVFVVSHNTFGWTKNNKNSVGKILTAYSSQTTAHILDAVKEGAIPNVNDLTFQVYKLFPDLGSDYETGVSFIMQPGISRIVDAYNSNKSIYSKDNKNPVHTAIKSLAKELLSIDGIEVSDRESIDSIMTKLQKYNGQVARLFGAGTANFKISLDDKESAKLLIAASRLKDRLKDKGIFEGSSPVEMKMRLLYDLGVILQYNKLSHLGNSISSYARVCNPDKFGAKQTIFATNKVFDDIDELSREEHPALYVESKEKGNQTFLEAIYPGVTRGLDNYITSSDMNSAYPPLHHFLKYATATAIKVNRHLFKTQSREFVSDVSLIKLAFTGDNKTLSEKVYKEYQNYILNYIYGQTDAVRNKVTYIQGEGFRFEAGTDVEEERRRIFGYGKSPDLRVKNEDGEMVEFEVEDINNPTQKEIDQFATLSPAQKVTWIQEHFRETGVFKYIRTTLFNNTQYRKTKAGAQTIEYVEGNDNIETVYNEFNKCFYNSNPLIALASLDIVKYAFAVEGFKMKRNAVNKVIKNDALIDDADHDGTGIVNQLNTKIRDIDTMNTDELRNNFVRSHYSSMYQIATHRVEKVNKQFELSRNLGDDIVLIDLATKEGKELAEKYDFIFTTGDKGNYSVNQYVKLRFGKVEKLYKIKEYGNHIYAYPLNKLEENESSTWSVNVANNVNPDESYYQALLSAIEDENPNTDEYSRAIEEARAKKSEHKFVNKNKAEHSTYATTFNINAERTVDSGGFEDVRNKVTNFFKTNPRGRLYLRSAALANYIKYTSAANGSIQTINGRQYVIQKVDFSKYNKKYIGKNNEHREVQERDPQIQAIMENAQLAGYRVNDAFLITPYNERQATVEVDEEETPNEIMHSSVTELGTHSMQTMWRRQISENDMSAAKALKRLHDKDIKSTDASVKNNVNEVITTTAEYVQVTTDKILNDLEYFIPDAEGHYHSVNDSETIDLIRNNPEERKRFLKTLLDARAFVRNYRMINDLDIDSEDPAIRNYLTKIKTAINKLQNATIINNAEERFANEYLAKLSENPLVQGDILSLLDGYHSAAAFDAWVNDLQETSSPLLQIITKEVMGDIRAKEMLATKRIREFRDKVKEIKGKAGANAINWKHIIDEDGKFVQDYNQEFIDKLNQLREDIGAKRSEFGEGSIEHLKAKYDYDKFKLEHTNQLLVDDYYQRKLELENHMLTHYSKTYSVYKKLDARRKDILSHAVNGTLEESYQDELKQVKKEMDALTAPYFFNSSTGQFEEKFSNSDPNNPLRGDDRAIMSIEAANALSSHLSAMRDLRKEYFAQDAKFGFDEELEKNLDIISNYEMRDSTGNITTPVSELMKHDDYVKAKEWVEHNARYVVGEETQKLINDAFAILREKRSGRQILSAIAKRDNLYDSHGVIDATKISDEDIAKIKAEQLANYNIREGQPFSDRSLINSAPTDDTIFSSAFYKGMTLNGAKNQDYIAKVNEINAILLPYYDNSSKTVYTAKMTTEELEKLDKLYEELEDIKKTENSSNGKSVHKFIKDHVEFVYDMDKYQAEKDAAIAIGGNYLRVWQRVNERIEEIDGKDTVVPNKYIYGYAVPKGYKKDGTGDNTYVDKKKTDALRTVRAYTTSTKTEYYYQKYKEMQAKGKEEFNAWYNANHIYNPYTHAKEPIQCWTRLEVNQMADDGEHTEAGMWVPAFGQLETRPKDGRDGEPDYLNHNYKQGASTAANYKKEGFTPQQHDNLPFGVDNINFDSTDYSNKNNMTDAEREMKELFENTLRSMATTNSAKRFLDRGYMASRAKSPERDAKFYAKEAAKMLGWIEGASGKEDWTEDVDYATDETIDMPMMSTLKSKDSVKVNYKMPDKKDYEDENAYNEAVKTYNENKKKAEEQNAKIHRELLDDNWESVMEDFIEKAAHFNAIQDNKYMLFYAKNMLDKIDVFVKNEGFNNLQKEGSRNAEGETRYVTKKDTRLQEQYVNWIRRLVYDQWKKPNNRLTRTANIMQSLTSAKFMMLNITGGIANVTVGETQILGESLAREYFGMDTYLKGKATWQTSLPSFFADMYSERASSLGSAIVKFMNVVDFDENSGLVHVPDAEEYMKRARDLMFSPQAMGEHFMQNGAMFSMIHSHRLFINREKDSNGKLSYTLKNEAEHMRDANEKALQDVLTDSQKQLWKKFTEYETKDANNKKEYAWFRKDLTTEFANLYLNDEQKKEFIDKRKDYQNKAKAEFNDDTEHPTLMSQLKLGKDGKLDFKEDSKLMEMGDEAYQLLGRFKGRVISVNKKIHGVYDRLGAAKWESYWWGGIVMQYHKHLYPGIMKRYRRQGYFNEERGTVEKGCYASIKDFLSLPLHKKKFVNKLKADTNISDSELQSVQGIQNIIKNYIEFALHVKTNYQMLPEYDRANIRRAIGDIAGVASALCMAIALRVIAGGDDDEGIIYNLAMYECDRLASESFMYNPFGLMSEGKKLWSSPVAVENGIEDIFSSLGFIAQWCMQGDDFDPYYQTGLYAGENKLWVNVRRQIPVYHAINMVERLNRSNKYYKLGDNMLSIVPVKDIADWIRK